MRLAAILAVTSGVAMCAALGQEQSLQEGPRVKVPAELRVVVGSAPYEVTVGGTEPWRLQDAWGRTHAKGTAATWKMERQNRRLRAVSADGQRDTAWSEEPFALVAEGPLALVAYGGKRYRGELRYVATDTAVLVVNVVVLEDYLRGVVPLEIGPRGPHEMAAVEAQAIAARSYTVVRALEGVTRPYDLTALATDQVYGGRVAETVVSDAAVAATRGIVLMYNGHVVRAPYHSTCGGTTAAPSEVWQGPGEGYLRSVIDQIPGTGKAWCDISPRYAWERVLDRRVLLDGIARRAGRRVGRVRGAQISSHTGSGRVGTLTFDTDAGVVAMQGNDIRFVLRGFGGELLPSTHFSLEAVVGPDGDVSQVTLRGRGNGHGVGMCQWGAIGRARAGSQFRDILVSYYPGTTLAKLEDTR